MGNGEPSYCATVLAPSAIAVDMKIPKIYYGYYCETWDEGRVTSAQKEVEETAVEDRA